MCGFVWWVVRQPEGGGVVFCEVFSRRGLKVIEDKSKVMVFGGVEGLDGAWLEQVLAQILRYVLDELGTDFVVL